MQELLRKGVAQADLAVAMAQLRSSSEKAGLTLQTGPTATHVTLSLPNFVPTTHLADFSPNKIREHERKGSAPYPKNRPPTKPDGSPIEDSETEFRKYGIMGEDQEDPKLRELADVLAARRKAREELFKEEAENIKLGMGLLNRELELKETEREEIMEERKRKAILRQTDEVTKERNWMKGENEERNKDFAWEREELRKNEMIRLKEMKMRGELERDEYKKLQHEKDSEFEGKEKEFRVGREISREREMEKDKHRVKVQEIRIAEKREELEIEKREKGLHWEIQDREMQVRRAGKKL
jgi:hypothetical protein